MATQLQDVTGSWVDIKSALSLVNGTKYFVQNIGSHDVFIYEKGSTPSDSEGIIIPPRGVFPLEPTASVNVYVKLRTGLPSRLAVTEAVFCQ